MQGARTYDPSTQWQPQVEAYFEASFGKARLLRMAKSLALPPKKLALRVNTTRIARDEAAKKLQEVLRLQHPPEVPSEALPCLLLEGTGPNAVDYDRLCGPAGAREVVVNRIAGEAILKGADVYVPGLLAASAGLAAGDLCAVSCALELPGSNWTGINRGQILRPPPTSTHLYGPKAGNLSICQPALKQKKQEPRPRDRSNLYLGAGRLLLGRKEMFRAQQGLALKMEHRIYDMPACNGILRGEVQLQALPSIVAAAAVDPQPGMHVLDMCAAPGGKATMLAELMGGSGKVVALDRTQPKVERIQSLAADLGLSHCVHAVRMDATTAAGPLEGLACSWGTRNPPQRGAGTDSSSSSRAHRRIADGHHTLDPLGAAHYMVQGPSSLAAMGGRARVRMEPGATGESPEPAPVVASAQGPFDAESFDAVLLDPPCSALGLRPRLTHSWSLQQMRSLGRYQRTLLAVAVRLLKPGGTLVYCTCTINPSENEANVRFVLDIWGHCLALEPIEIPGIRAQPGLIGSDPETGEGWLEPEEAGYVLRFNPADESTDCIGFFVSRFTKTKMVP